MTLACVLMAMMLLDKGDILLGIVSLFAAACVWVWQDPK